MNHYLYILAFLLLLNFRSFGAVFAGDGFSLFTDEDNVLWALGKNDVGQLGLGRESSYEPVPVCTNMRNIEDILEARGYASTCYFLRELSYETDLYGNDWAFIHKYHFRGLKTLYDGVTTQYPIRELILYGPYSTRRANLFVRFDSNVDFLAGPLLDYPECFADYLLADRLNLTFILNHFLTSSTYSSLHQMIYQKSDLSLWHAEAENDSSSTSSKNDIQHSKLGDLPSKIKKVLQSVLLTEDNSLYRVENKSLDFIESNVGFIATTDAWSVNRDWGQGLSFFVFSKDNQLKLLECNSSASGPSSFTVSDLDANGTDWFTDEIEDIDFSEGRFSFNPTIPDDVRDQLDKFFSISKGNLLNDLTSYFESYPESHGIEEFQNIIDANYSSLQRGLALREVASRWQGHVVFRKIDGSVWGVGDNSFNQLGNTGKFSHIEPIQIYPFPTDSNNTRNESGSESGTNSSSEITSITQSIEDLKNQLLKLVSKDELTETLNNFATVESLATAVDDGKISGILEVIENPSTHGLTHIEILESSGATPHTNGWYYQEKWGWLWTSAKIFPYVFRVKNEENTSDWLYFRENSSPPLFYNYTTEKWVALED